MVVLVQVKNEYGYNLCINTLRILVSWIFFIKWHYNLKQPTEDKRTDL